MSGTTDPASEGAGHMTHDKMFEVIGVIDDILQGVAPYKIIGRAAMVYHGCGGGTSVVTVACRKDDRNIVETHVRTHDILRFPKDKTGNLFGYWGPGDKSPCRVRLAPLEAAGADRAGISTEPGNIITLPRLVNIYARHCVMKDRERRFGDGEEEDENPVNEVICILRRIIELKRADRGDGELVFTEAKTPCVLSPVFLLPFVSEHPEGYELLWEAGAVRCFAGEDKTTSLPFDNSSKVAPLRSLLNKYARHYVECRKRRCEDSEEKNLAEDIMWMLSRIIELRRAGGGGGDELALTKFKTPSSLLDPVFQLWFCCGHSERLKLLRGVGAFPLVKDCGNTIN